MKNFILEKKPLVAIAFSETFLIYMHLCKIISIYHQIIFWEPINNFCRIMLLIAKIS